MSQLSVPEAVTGTNCPYCRFPLKTGAAAFRCESCQAIHHNECWAANGGCALLGCATKATVAASPPGPAFTATQVPPPTAPVPERGPRRPVPVAAWTLLAVIVAAGGGFALATGTRGDDDSSTPASKPAPEAKTTPGPSVPERERTAVDRLDAILVLAAEGRTAVIEQRYAEAVSNRRAVLVRLRGVQTPSPRLRVAKRRLVEAMQASLDADLAYQAGSDPTADNARATDGKRAFLDVYNPIAEELSAQTYREVDF